MQHDLVVRAAARPGGVATLHLAGVVDAHTLDRFETALRKSLEQGAKALVLDCEELRYVNSAGFGELIRYFDRLSEQGGTLVLARVPPKVGVILEMLGLKSLIPIATGLEEAVAIARKGPEAAKTVAAPAPAGDRGIRAPGTPPPSRMTQTPASDRIRTERPVLTEEKRLVTCACCDTRLRLAGEGRWACPACGAPFSATREGGLAFDWSAADAEGVHMTFDVSPRTLAAFAGMLEGVLVERRVAHARMRRFSREAAHVCHLIAKHACEGRPGPLHVLALAGAHRLHLRIVDRGRHLGEEAARVFAAQARLFLDFEYTSPVEGLNVTEFAFAYKGSGVFVS